ncbi:EVE domain-containing protein [Pedomonas mirosovicensis]|uniref:EVE domain-containing protein n=1 Tax=Pedomonas mirosovicensis TaxID=2908641 RepID=UPI0021699C2C|nr:EVE domain-containing protein [Pedomonas mirosovicensis]MCH8684903.1 EVE domain-containing protein [Pedomonas mirosovicensis]
MAYWLLKTEPGSWSWGQQAASSTTAWDGVANAQALKNMRAMAVGDRAFFYHTGNEKQVVGLIEITRAFYPDPNDPASGLVDVKALSPLPRPVTLAAIKAEPQLAGLALVKQPRLSVLPVDDASWARICEMGGVD